MTTTGSYSQDFNTLITSGSATWTDNSTIPNWYAQRTGSGNLVVADDGSSNTGNLYSYGTGTASDRALGSVGSNNATAGNFAWGLLLRNTSGTVITDIRIGYIGEQWRNSAAAAQTVSFYYQISSSIITSLTPNVITGWTPVAGLHVTTPITGGTAEALDGNNATNQSGFANVIIPSLVLNNGEYIMIKWDDPDHSGNDHGMAIDDFIVNWIVSSNTITTGTVSSPPFVLTNCLDTETGTVDFTSTGTFNAGNNYTAQLSNDIGSFASPVNIGTLAASGNSPSGTITITIPAGSVGGTGYRIRVVSDNPAVIGTSSAAFTIIQGGVGGCASSHTDYYRSVATGNWGSVSTWESSPDNTNWISATLSPTHLANTITIQSSHTVTIAASVSADQVLIMGGGVLNHSLGTFTIEDGTGSDIDINGIFILSSAANAPVFNGSATCNVATGGILRVSATGLTGVGAGVNANNYVYQDQSVLEYTLTTPFSASGVTYFPNVNASTIPTLRVTAVIGLSVGGTSNTIINGLFECNGAAIWESSGTKTFRNGIIGSGSVTALATSGKFIINGTTAKLGGTGSLTVPPTGGLEIGSPTTVTMISDKTITGNVSLLSTFSLIDLGVFNLSVTGTISITQVSSYVKTASTGKLTLQNVGSGAGGKLFPVGKSTINPLYISSGTPADYSARIVEPITPPIYADLQAVLRTWYITSSVTSPAATISFGYSFPGDCGVLYSNTGPAEVGVNISGVWNIHQTGLTPVAFPLVPGTFSVTPGNVISYFNNPATEFPFVIANNFAILSNDCIISILAQKRNNTGIINWTVNSCADVTSFELQRSVNNGGYQTIHTIQPGALETDFSFTDAALGSGRNLYRIKVNRLSGAIKYSNTVVIIHNSNDILISSLAPNPVHNIAKLVISTGKTSMVDFKVYNISGMLVKQWQAMVTEGNNIIEMNVSGLPAGMYNLFVANEVSNSVSRFVKQ